MKATDPKFGWAIVYAWLVALTLVQVLESAAVLRMTALNSEQSRLIEANLELIENNHMIGETNFRLISTHH